MSEDVQKAIEFAWYFDSHCGKEKVEQVPGIGDGQGGLVCCDSWGRKESDMTERLN